MGERRRLKEERERKREETSRDRQIELILLPSTRRRNNTNDDKREKERRKERFDIVKKRTTRRTREKLRIEVSRISAPGNESDNGSGEISEQKVEKRVQAIKRNYICTCDGGILNYRATGDLDTAAALLSFARRAERVKSKSNRAHVHGRLFHYSRV